MTYGDTKTKKDRQKLIRSARKESPRAKALKSKKLGKKLKNLDRDVAAHLYHEKSYK